MQEQNVSPNVAHAVNTQALAAAVQLGTEVIRNCLGTEEVSATLNGKVFEDSDIREALTARLAKKLGV
ncbi:hypothetical protein D3C87_1287760 [compost metagenome]